MVEGAHALKCSLASLLFQSIVCLFVWFLCCLFVLDVCLFFGLFKACRLMPWPDRRFQCFFVSCVLFLFLCFGVWFPLFCLFVCLFACLFVCLFVCLLSSSLSRLDYALWLCTYDLHRAAARSKQRWNFTYFLSRLFDLCDCFVLLPLHWVAEPHILSTPAELAKISLTE